MPEPADYDDLTEEELSRMPPGPLARFTPEELRQAARRIMPPTEVEPFVQTVLDLGPGGFLVGDILSALSLLGPEAAATVREMLNETPAQEAFRLQEFRARYPDPGR